MEQRVVELARTVHHGQLAERLRVDRREARLPVLEARRIGEDALQLRERFVEEGYFRDGRVVGQRASPEQDAVLMVVHHGHGLPAAAHEGEVHGVDGGGLQVGVTALHEEVVAVGHLVGQLSVLRPLRLGGIGKHQLQCLRALPECRGKGEGGEQVVVRGREVGVVNALGGVVVGGVLVAQSGGELVTTCQHGTPLHEAGHVLLLLLGVGGL